jgi:hypothetical protein
MKIIIENINENPANALRRCGYHFERHHPNTRELSAARALGAGGFPRFHAYVKIIDGHPSTRSARSGLIQMEINLHLDQKRPIYKGASAHSGEYGGEIVEQEAERIKSIILCL